MNDDFSKIPSLTVTPKKNILSLLLVLVLSASMLYYTEVIPSIGDWYSFDQSLRLQTKAFMRGELSLQPVPYGHRHDWAWGNGIQQIWGLGVPFIQLPFEIVAKLFGSFGFPDRIIFLLCYGFVTALLWKSLDINLNSNINAKKRLARMFQNIPALFFVMLNPAFITMMRAKFGPYEEVIAYGYLWAIMLFALMLIFMKTPNRNLYLLICLLAGFSASIRPTTGAYGLMTFLIALYFATQYRIKSNWIGVLLFLAGNLFLLITNYLRFGNPLEFGHRLILTGVPVIDYILKFDNPMHFVPFTSSALELLSALFFLDISKEGLLWNINVPRMREFNFDPYGPFTLVLLTTAWLAILITWTWAKINKSTAIREKQPAINVGAVWSFFSFVMMFLFYSQSPALASRYFVDFGAAVVIGIISLFFYLMTLGRQRLSDKSFLHLNVMVSVVFTCVIFIGLSQARIKAEYGWLSKMELTNVTTAGIAQNKLVDMRHTAGPQIPALYSCGDRETKYDIPNNNAGWDMSATCLVSQVTTHFLDNPQCLALHIEPVPDMLLRSYPDEDIEVKSGLESMHRTSETDYGRGKIITYCLNKNNTDANNSGQQLKLISIAWVSLQRHPDLSPPPMRLISLRKLR